MLQHLCFVYEPALNTLLHSRPLDVTDWIAPTPPALAGLPVVALELRFWHRQVKYRRDGATAGARRGHEGR